MTSTLCKFYHSTIGKKIIVAVSGLVMVGWLVGHMVGNLQIYAGEGTYPDKALINQYADMLHSNIALLWGVRIIMAIMAFLHITNTFALVRLNQQARPQNYQLKKSVQSTFASRTMAVGGVIILSYLVFHIFHLTLGKAYSDLFVEGDVYGNMVRSFQVPAISIIYLIGQAALLLHLLHGIQSIPKTLGVSCPKFACTLTFLGRTLAIVIVLGFSSIPVAVLAGWIK